jgi:hypothetical protein
MIADGHENVWICQIGRRKTDGSFASFIQQLSKAMVEVNGLRVSYQAHGTGKVTFGWNEPFTVEGKAIPLHNYPRWDNIYTHMEFGAERFRVEFKGEKLNLDFQSEVRDL